MASIVKSKGESNFEPVPMGTHVARCITVVNLGLQESKWGPKAKHYIGFEVPSVRVEWEKDKQKHEGPAIIGSTYTSSLSPKAILRQHLESWRGKAFTEAELEAFDLMNLLGVPCMLSVTHTVNGSNVYANIASIMGLPKGMECPQQEGEILRFDPTEPTATTDLAKLPNWMREKIEKGAALAQHQTESPAPQGIGHADYSKDEFDDDIPF